MAPVPRNEALIWASKRNEHVPEKLVDLTRPHVDSFNWFVEKGVHEAVSRIIPMDFIHPETGARLKMWYENVELNKPLHDMAEEVTDDRMFPSECRGGSHTYAGRGAITVCFRVDDGAIQRLSRPLGRIPVMTRSKMCHLHGLTRGQLVRRKEESLEMGGYFIINGIERIIRMLILPRRHHVMGLKRAAFLKRGPTYSQYACAIRCVRPDQTAATVRVHYLNDGTCTFGFSLRRQEFLIPVAIIMKALVECTDREIFERLTASSLAAPDASGLEGARHDKARQDKAGGEGEGAGDSGLAMAFVHERAELLLRHAQRLGLLTRVQCLEFLGKRLRNVLDVSSAVSDLQAGEILLQRLVFVHLESNADKFNLLIYMLQKLYGMVNGAVAEDNADGLNQHELLLPGHLLTMMFKERLEEWFIKLKVQILADINGRARTANLHDAVYLKKLFDKVPLDVGQKFEYMLATGNLNSPSGLDLQQASGFTVVAEKLNYLRYLSHFRSVHRGAYFAELRTTTVRKLLPESWGFMCPVHTPDGSPCGLLNHLTMSCQVVTDSREDDDAIEQRLASVLGTCGLIPATPSAPVPAPPAYVTVLLDGRVMGSMRPADARRAAEELRLLKASNEDHIPRDMEVAYIPCRVFGEYPGLFLFTQPARMMRPVKRLDASGSLQMIGSLEQVYMDITCPDGGDNGGLAATATHTEVDTRAFLSIVANLTPWSDYNQSPRNMYQCQMGKQTMANSFQNHEFRPENKAYRLHTPQMPIAHTQTYNDYCVNDFPLGTNAVVAVISYTGYDMEDAMIINKSSMERGFAHASLYKTETMDLRAEKTRADGKSVFGYGGKRSNPHGASIDSDGLPYVGQRLKKDSAYAAVTQLSSSRTKVSQLKGAEEAVVEQVSVIGTGTKEELQVAKIKMRFNRNPQIGDKFSSRHGQKGVLSQLWPDIDMPFCAVTGMRPDIIINPHAFPSRMTIGMLVESMASKAGALHGFFPNASPFQFDVKAKEGGMVAKFGQELVKKGFNYYGNEVMTSGVLGTELKADIYIGLVYYQRLRHMVSDKFQVRSTGPVNSVHHQPVKGRKVGGGIRFGEMERDSLLSHGAAYLLHDRLHTCSDYHVAHVCSACGSMLSTSVVPPKMDMLAATDPLAGAGRSSARVVTCNTCGTPEHVEKVAMPYVFRFLAAELAGMNMKLTLQLD
eukprot:jgi/Mesvir1/13505/Mv10505-RA.1